VACIHTHSYILRDFPATPPKEVYRGIYHGWIAWSVLDKPRRKWQGIVRVAEGSSERKEAGVLLSNGVFGICLRRSQWHSNRGIK
jgi:hypothetical protein